jgi:hypothetical protein
MLTKRRGMGIMAVQVDALNYPYIRVRDLDWLKQTLLIFPHVARMTPAVRGRVVYEAGYDAPKIERNPGFLFDMLETDTLTCDLSGVSVTRDSSVIVSPWDFKVHDELREAARKFGKERVCPLLTEDENVRDLGDWNSWLVKKELASCLFS